MRQRENVVKIVGRQQLTAPKLKPLLFGQRLTLGTMAITATVVGVTEEPTLAAPIAMASQQGRAAATDVVHGFGLCGAQRMGSPVGVPVAIEDVCKFDPWCASCRRVLCGGNHDTTFRNVQWREEEKVNPRGCQPSRDAVG